MGRRTIFFQHVVTRLAPGACLKACLKLGAAFSLLFLMGAPISASDNYPNRPIKILVPYAPGGLPDTVARVVGEKMQALLNNPIVIENRPGSSGGIAASAILSSPADGYTLLLTEGSILYNSLILKNPPYDWRELVAVAQVAQAPQFLAISTRIPATSVPQFVEYVKSKQGALNYGSAGLGSPHHLAMEAVKSALKLDMIHIPYKGANQAVPALVGGHIDVLWSAYPSIAGFAKDNQVRLLATNSPERSEQAPDVPPMADFIPGFNTASIVGIFAKKGTPEAIIKKIAEAAVAATKDANVKSKLFLAGVDASGKGPAEYTAALAAERERIARIVTEAKIEQP